MAIVAAMDTPWRHKDLPDIVRALSQRPGHEAVRTLVAEILRHAFGAAYLDLDHEVRLPEVHGRVDTLFGATVFEFKRDLRREMPDVEARLPDYLRERERQTGRRYLGIATDGATFIAFEMRDGGMVRLGSYETRRRGEESRGWRAFVRHDAVRATWATSVEVTTQVVPSGPGRGPLPCRASGVAHLPLLGTLVLVLGNIRK